MLTAEVAHKPTLRAVRGRNDRPIVLPGVTVPAPSREEGGQMKSVRHGLVGLVCVPLVLLAACEDGDSKSDEPTPSASPSASLSDSDSDLPEAQPAAEVTPVELVQAWIDAYNGAITTGFTERVRIMTDRSCAACEALISDVETVYEAGGQFEFASAFLTPRGAEVVNDDGGPVKVRVNIDLGAGSRVEKVGGPATRFKGERGVWTFELRIKSGRWRVHTLDPR